MDWDLLARTAPTRFERVYYGHRGSAIFKWAHYLPTYDRLLQPFVGKPITLVEVGLATGGSLQLWRDYLGPDIKIIGVDLDPSCKRFEDDNTRIMIGDQGDPAFMRQVAEAVGEADVVIDDGSHINAHQILTFETLFPIVKIGGVYVCEDLHTSYWADYGGGFGRQDTFIGYAKQAIDKLHFKYGVGELPPNDPARHIGAMIVTDSLIAFEKAEPAEVFMAMVGGDQPIA